MSLFRLWWDSAFLALVAVWILVVGVVAVAEPVTVVLPLQPLIVPIVPS